MAGTEFEPYIKPVLWQKNQLQQKVNLFLFCNQKRKVSHHPRVRYFQSNHCHITDLVSTLLYRPT